MFSRKRSLMEGLNIRSPFGLPESSGKQNAGTAHMMLEEADIATRHLHEENIGTLGHHRRPL